MKSPTRFFICISLFVLFGSSFLSYGQNSKKSDILNYFTRQSDAVNHSRFAGQPNPSKDLLGLLDRQAKWDDGGPVELNPLRLHMRFQQVDEPGTKETGAPARYRVFVEGAPENKVFSFISWPINDNLQIDARDMYVNGQGLVLLRKPRPDQEMSLKAVDDELTVTPSTDSAEPMRYVLSRRDGEMQVFGTLVPHPVVSQELGCRLEVLIAQPSTTAVLIVADGFPAKAKIPFVLESEGAQDSKVLTTNVNGHVVLAAFPYVPGKSQGTLKVSAEGPNCLPSVVLPWGPLAPVAPKVPEK
jgi:hypothetical protein